MNHVTLSGLFVCAPRSEPAVPVPLLGVAVEAELTGGSARVVLAQRFKNTEARAIEAVYLFPLPSDAAVCGFEAEVDGRRVEGRVEERDRAFAIYDDAMAEGHGAFLMDQERPDVFTLSVGNLAAGSEAVIRLTWVARLPCEGEALRFNLPTTVSPRYTPRSAPPEIGQPDADKLAPERRFAVPYGLTLKLTVDGAVSRVESPSHPIRTTLQPAGAVVELAQTSVALDRDVVIIVEPATPRTPNATVARDAEGGRYVQLSFLPRFEATGAGAEVVFLVDCSGSMGGDSIVEARRALELCVRGLDLRDRFDVVRFGSTFEALFGAARPFDEDSLAAAVAFVHATDANLGGTEIVTPLEAILRRPLAPGQTRQVLLLTDGQVANEHEVIELARAHADSARIFAFGIGAGASEHLVREVARQSRGAVELIAPGERIEPKVLRQFGRVRSPALSDVRVDWGGLDVEQAPRLVPPVFEGELLTVWAKVRSGSASQATLSAGGERWVVPLDLERAAAGGPVPALWGRAAIRDLEAADGRHGSSQQRAGKEQQKNDALIAIGKTLGLVSSATSYVAVELRPDGQRVLGGSQLRRVPIALTHGWGGSNAGVAGSMPQGFRAMAMPAPAGAPAPVRRAMSKARALFDAMPEDVAARSFSAAPGFVKAPSAREQAPDPLYALLLTQRADGSFPAAPPVLRALRDRGVFEALAAKHGEAQVATALVLALLARDHADRRSEWRAAADKAQRFLAGAAIDVAALI